MVVVESLLCHCSGCGLVFVGVVPLSDVGTAAGASAGRHQDTERKNAESSAPSEESCEYLLVWIWVEQPERAAVLENGPIL